MLLENEEKGINLSYLNLSKNNQNNNAIQKYIRDNLNEINWNKYRNILEEFWRKVEDLEFEKFE